MKQISIIVASIFLMVLFLPINLNQRALVISDNLKNDYNEAVDNAADDAAKALMISQNNESVELIGNGGKVDFQKTDLNLKEGLSKFYNSLYINLGIQDNNSEKQALLNKIPIIIATGYDGYYIHTWQETKDSSGKLNITNDWTPKKLYSIFDDKYNIKISFTLGDYVYIEDYNTNEKYEGDKENFASKYPYYFGNNFSNIRNQAISQLIQKDLEFYTFSNNNIAKRNGWKLKFNIPYYNNRSIDSVSFIAFIQGKLITGTENYDTYGFGTAKIVKRKPVYGYERDGYRYYSTKNDEGTNIKAFYNEFESAENGYCPDPRYYK